MIILIFSVESSFFAHIVSVQDVTPAPMQELEHILSHLQNKCATLGSHEARVSWERMCRR